MVMDDCCLNKIVAMDLEGIVCKQKDSPKSGPSIPEKVQKYSYAYAARTKQLEHQTG
jgi:hypothetical protein